MKKYICPMALVGLFCCATYSRPAVADVTGSIVSQQIDFPVVSGSTSVTATVTYTVTNNNATDCTTNLNNKMTATRPQYNDYQLWSLDDPWTISANSTPSQRTSTFPVRPYQISTGYTWRTDSTLTGLTGFPKTITTTKAY